MLVTAPTVSKLLGRPRLWGHRQIKAGRYGPIAYRRGRWPYVHLEQVEVVEGRTFTPEQLRAAGIAIKPGEGANGRNEAQT
jgi:hypothetical protein